MRSLIRQLIIDLFILLRIFLIEFTCQCEKLIIYNCTNNINNNVSNREYHDQKDL